MRDEACDDKPKRKTRSRRKAKNKDSDMEASTQVSPATSRKSFPKSRRHIPPARTRKSDALRQSHLGETKRESKPKAPIQRKYSRYRSVQQLQASVIVTMTPPLYDRVSSEDLKSHFKSFREDITDMRQVKSKEEFNIHVSFSSIDVAERAILDLHDSLLLDTHRLNLTRECNLSGTVVSQESSFDSSARGTTTKSKPNNPATGDHVVTMELLIKNIERKKLACDEVNTKDIVKLEKELHAVSSKTMDFRDFEADFEKMEMEKKMLQHSIHESNLRKDVFYRYCATIEAELEELKSSGQSVHLPTAVSALQAKFERECPVAYLEFELGGC